MALWYHGARKLAFSHVVHALIEHSNTIKLVSLKCVTLIKHTDILVAIPCESHQTVIANQIASDGFSNIFK